MFSSLASPTTSKVSASADRLVVVDVVGADGAHEPRDVPVLGLLPLLNVHPQLLVGLRHVVQCVFSCHAHLQLHIHTAQWLTLHIYW